jgi:SAM-dependent methyltransferase
MSGGPVPAPYRWLAGYYDELFGPWRKPMDRARKRLLRSVLPHVETGCDLACGTGTTAIALARTGIRMFAVDLSPRMCRCARQKAAADGVPLKVIHADMRNFVLPERVGLVSCEYDALNHVPRRADLRKVCRSVARALLPGGWFYFDVNNAEGFERYWTGTVWIEKPGIVLVMRNGHACAGAERGAMSSGSFSGAGIGSGGGSASRRSAGARRRSGGRWRRKASMM